MGQILNGLISHSVHLPTSDGSAHGLCRLIANGWKKADKEFSVAIFRSSGSEGVPQKIKFSVWIIPSSARILTIDNLCLFGIQFQSAMF
jgi:hypothetical protein